MTFLKYDITAFGLQHGSGMYVFNQTKKKLGHYPAQGQKQRVFIIHKYHTTMKPIFRMNFKHHEKALRKSIDDFQHDALKQAANGMLNSNRITGGWLKMSFCKDGNSRPH